MPIEVEFLLIALAIFIWESLLWLPMRNPVLWRHAWGRRWTAYVPGSLFAARETGVLPLPPAPFSGGLAPCQSPPLLPGSNGEVLLEDREAHILSLGNPGWEELSRDGHHLLINGRRIRIASPRAVEDLTRGKRSGLTLHAALNRQWRRSLSPMRAKREWRRWRLVSFQLRLLGPVLTFGFFAGLPLFYLYGNLMQALLFGAWLWLLMVFISVQLWWLGKRVYPGARGTLRMDAALSVLIPFHAMRATEIASVHAMATTHPAALLLATGNRDNPWLARFSRRLLFPAPGVPEDAAFSAAIMPLLEKHLDVSRHASAPPRDEDDESSRYCPRCHALFLSSVTRCPDCRGVELREF